MDLDEITKRLNEEENRRPRAAACKRGKYFDAEVIFNGKQYCVGTSYVSRDTALEEADKHVQEMIKQMVNIAEMYVMRFPQAKP